VEEGIEDAEYRHALRPDYDDAMAYMNLLYQQRSEIHCGHPVASDADIKSGGDWLAPDEGDQTRENGEIDRLVAQISPKVRVGLFYTG